MTALRLSSLGLFLLLIGCASPDPEADIRPRVVHSSVCQEHTDLHNRMDAIEKTVEDAVDRLEGELVELLEKIEDPQWSPLVDSTNMKTVDILEDPPQRHQ
ncbi:hypothetical protein NL108_013066 [Boleophthalmus pectinirostris]|nr:hypothetical protein NL108_013066 [Boleophthalmus pectinirostris]